MTVWRLGVFGRVPGSCCPAGVPADDPAGLSNRLCEGVSSYVKLGAGFRGLEVGPDAV